MTTARKTLFSRIDGATVLLYLVLVTIGLLAVYSVEHRSTDTAIFMMNKSYTKQLLWFVYSLLFGLVIMLTDSKFFSSFAFLAYTIGLFVLAATIFVGVDVKGSRSWLGVGSFRFQPGEVCKIFTSMAIAKYLSLPETNFKKLRSRLFAVGIALFPALLIILQKETGLALVYLCFFLVLYREGLPGSILVVGFSVIALVLMTLLVDRLVLFILLTVIAGLIAFISRPLLKRKLWPRVILIGGWLLCMLFSQVAVPFTFKHVLQRHQVDRIYSMLGKEVPADYYSRDSTDEDEHKGNSSEYNVLQSKIAIGSGGLWGKGFLNGTSTKNQFVPEQNTDFIFCAIGEQFGFVGSLLLVAIYVSLMMRILFIAERQRSPFTRVYAYCVASILFFHFAVNISMTVGLAPVIGITLPFLSYGGSSLMSFSVLIFILLRLDADRGLLIR
jgi:rod shape determining protein RodA